MFGGIAFSITIPLYLFFIAYVLKAEEMAIFMLTFFYLTNIIAVPFWVWLSKQIGKHKAYICSFAMIAFAHPFYLLLGEGDFWWMLPITITTGLQVWRWQDGLLPPWLGPPEGDRDWCFYWLSHEWKQPMSLSASRGALEWEGATTQEGKRK